MNKSPKIWRTPLTPELLNVRNKGTLADLLGIVFTDIGDDFLMAHMPVTPHHLQPEGIMHGGASCVFAETVGSVAANYCVDFEKFYCVGLDINTNHISAARTGKLIALGKPFHIGRMTQVWSIEIRDEKEKLISITRLTLVSINKYTETT